MLTLLRHVDVLKLIKRLCEYPTPSLTSLSTPMGHFVRKAARY